MDSPEFGICSMNPWIQPALCQQAAAAAGVVNCVMLSFQSTMFLIPCHN